MWNFPVTGHFLASVKGCELHKQKSDAILLSKIFLEKGIKIIALLEWCHFSFPGMFVHQLSEAAVLKTTQKLISPLLFVEREVLLQSG